MAEFKTYSDHSMSLLMGDREPILKSILRQLFEGIYSEIKDKCILEEVDKKDINEFLKWPDDHDLNGTARYFIWNFFSHKIIERVVHTRKFSLKDIYTIINKPKFKNQLEEKRRLVSQLEIKKKFKFSIKQINEVGVISAELIRIRNLAAHNNGLENSSQALILMSNISRLLNMIPDSIREATNGFGSLEQFVREDFLDSILSVIRPDIEESIEDARLQSETASEEDGDLFNEVLVNKIDDMSNQLRSLKEINAVLSKQDNTLENILSLVYSPRPSMERQWSFDNESRKDIQDNEILSSEQVEKSLAIELEESLDDIDSELYQSSRSEIYDSLMKLRVKIKKEMSLEYPAFRNWHNLLMSNLANSMLDNELTSLEILKSDETFQHYYDSKQMYGKLLAHYNLNDKKKAAVEYFDIQIERYWPLIEATLKDYFSNE
tara:strand:- start:1234 stop:2538 length:1305 start_codon:yes stop_codon:yes gene_type:complete